MADRAWPPQLDPLAAAQLLGYGSLVGPRSLRPDLEEGLPRWELPAPARLPQELAGLDARADCLWTLLCTAVEAAVVGCSSPRIPLSGGLDSRAVAAAAAASAPGGLSAGTFGDPDCADLKVAAEVAAALGIEHRIDRFEPDCALFEEERVWRATDGRGGPGASPGAPTDASWARECDVLLSGTSGDVVWGQSVAPGPSPDARLRRVGLGPATEAELPVLPPAPEWASESGESAWRNLWTRQRAVTWDGVLPRLAFTPVAPIPWDEPLLSYCLALGGAERRERRLVQRMLERHAPRVAVDRIPLAPRRPVHDLDRAFRQGPAWQAELERWVAPRGPSADAFERLGIRREEVARLVTRHRSGRRDRAQFLSRLRALWRWGLED